MTRYLKNKCNSFRTFFKYIWGYAKEIPQQIQNNSNAYAYKQWVNEAIKKGDLSECCADAFGGFTDIPGRYGGGNDGVPTYPFSLGDKYTRKENGKYKIDKVCVDNNKEKFIKRNKSTTVPTKIKRI